MFTLATLDEKIHYIKRKFQEIQEPYDKYNFLIDFGKKLPPFEQKYKIEENLVKGCQSQLFLRAEMKEGKIFFSATSDALISAGLAALLTFVYSGEGAESILSTPPAFLTELGIYASLSPNRSQGLAHIYLKMKMFAIILSHEQHPTPSMDRIQSDRDR